MSQSSGDRPISHLEGHARNILKLCQYIGVGVILALMILTVANSIGRYGFNQPVNGVIELSSYLLLTSAFLVGGYVMVVKSHITIGIFVDRLSERTQAIFDSLTYMFCLVVAIAAVWQSVSQGIFMMEARQATAILHIPHFPFYFLIAFGWGLLGVAILMQLIDSLHKGMKRWLP